MSFSHSDTFKLLIDNNMGFWAVDDIKKIDCTSSVEGYLKLLNSIFEASVIGIVSSLTYSKS